MRKILPLFLGCLLLAGCASPRIPDWTYAGANQLEAFKKSFLDGEEKIAALHFTRAAEEIKKSGDLAILARAYLTRYALQTAVLETGDDGMYRKIAAVQATPENTSFHHLLAGDVAQVDIGSLPEPYRPLAEALRTGNRAEIAAAVAGIDDPLSRIIAAGVIVMHREYDEPLLQTAVAAAAANGWKKPLLVYLDKLARYYHGRQDAEQEEGIRRRIELLR